MTKLLDLRDKSINKVRVVEHIIFKPRSFRVEMIKMLSIIAIVSVLGWGISNADNLNPFLENGIETATENFSALGQVSEITQSNITLTDARGSDKSGNTTYILDITHLEKVETSSYTPLIITDIKVGDKVITQGLTNGQAFFIKRIVSFSTSETASTTLPTVATTTPDTATSTATTTTDTASSTVEVSTSTPESNSNESTTTPEIITSTSTETSTTTEEATTTPGIIEQVGDVVSDVIETVTEIVETVVETVTGNTEPEPTPPPVEEAPSTLEPIPEVNPEPSV